MLGSLAPSGSPEETTEGDSRSVARARVGSVNQTILPFAEGTLPQAFESA